MRYIIPGLAILLFFSSCKDNSKSDLAVFRAADEGLRQSINTISISNNIIYKAFEDRLRDPFNSERTKIWYPKAMLVKTLSDSMIKYIGEVKSDIKNEAPDKTGDKESFNQNDLNVAEHVFESHNKGKELFEKLIKYRQDLLSIDPELNKVFSPILIVFAKGFDYTGNDSKIFTKTFFNKIPAIAAMAMLSKFENNVKIIENNFITFCLSNGYSTFCGFSERPWPLVTQSTNYIKGGELIEITAGVGSFSFALQPKAIIDEKEISADENGVMIYKFKTPLKAGKYTKPVKMEYTTPDGNPASMTKNIEYTVIEEQ